MCSKFREGYGLGSLGAGRRSFDKKGVHFILLRAFHSIEEPFSSLSSTARSCASL
jgi:hypothetical protein